MEAMECDVSNSVNGQSPSEQNQDNLQGLETINAGLSGKFIDEFYIYFTIPSYLSMLLKLARWTQMAFTTDKSQRAFFIVRLK